MDDWLSMSGKQRKAFTLRLVQAYGWRCCLCGLPIKSEADLSCEHLIPRAHGGTTSLESCRPAHRSCNSAKGDRMSRPVDAPYSGLAAFTNPQPAQSTSRVVILVCGPPGAGKTTRARELARTHQARLYDLDDEQWAGSEARFTQALEQIGKDPRARAVVIRAGATGHARAKASSLVGATRVIIIDTPADECKRRVRERNRPRPPIRQQIAAVDAWWRAFER